MENILAKQFQHQYEMMLDWVNENINALTDDEFKIELSSGKNHGVWILGHLITSDSDFSMFMGKGEIIYPMYSEMFGQGSKLFSPEKYPSVSLLKIAWSKICEKNKKIYSELKDKELAEPHAMIKDYETDYFKTKDRVIMAWQLHQLYHAGQLAIIVSRVGKSKY